MATSSIMGTQEKDIMDRSKDSREPHCIQFGVEAFKDYASDTAYRIQRGLELMGYTPYGRRFPGGQDRTDMAGVVRDVEPDIVVAEEWNTWNPSMSQPPSKDVGFDGYDEVGRMEGLLRVTKHADPWGHPDAHQEWQTRFNPHAVLVRYDPAQCIKIAPYMEGRRLLRIYHTVVRELCPEPSADGRDKVCLLSGASNRRNYPVRGRLWDDVRGLQNWERDFTIRAHHHWSRTDGSAVPDYMVELRRHKVMLVGCSRWDVAFKKHWEGTAAGCIVVTNLSSSVRVPGIEPNFVRVHDDISAQGLRDLCGELAADWDVERQRHFAKICVDRYDFRVEAARIHGVLTEQWRRAGVGQSRRRKGR